MHIIGTYRHWISCAAVTFGAEAIQSANIVGFNTVTLYPGYNMLAVNFQKVGDQTAISLQDLIPGNTAGLTGATAAGKSEVIQVYIAETGEYEDYWLYYNARKPTDTKNYKWIDAATGDIATKTFANGDSFWFLKRGDANVNVSIAGQVSVQPTDSIDIVSGFNMIGYAFPANFNPNTYGADFWKSAIAAGAVAGTAAGKSDVIQVYNASTGEYADYWFYNNARKPTDEKNGRWIDAASGSVVDTTAEVMPTGKGAWYLHRGTGFTLELANPISK